MKQSKCAITSNTEVMPGTYLMWMAAPGIAECAQPGQFVTVRCADLILRRPFSVCQSSSLTNETRAGEEIAILYRIAGKGTLWLSQREAGETLDVLGPAGRGFALPPAPAQPLSTDAAAGPTGGRANRSQKSGRLLLAAGGVGIAPLIFLLHAVLRACAERATPGCRVTLVHGARTAAQLYPIARELCASSAAGSPPRERDLSRPSVLPEGVDCIPVTEDGSAGVKGLLTDVLPGLLDGADRICACGPLDMYRTMAEMSAAFEGAGEARRSAKLKECQVSLEVTMGCGFGACYSCTIKTVKGLQQVCRDGPVFPLGDIIWQEVKT